MLQYDGSYQVIDIKGDEKFILRNTLTGRTREQTHANHIERYNEMLTPILKEMREQINHDRDKFLAECVGY